jgi:hypothetical protein
VSVFLPAAVAVVLPQLAFALDPLISNVAHKVVALPLMAQELVCKPVFALPKVEILMADTALDLLTFNVA